MVKSPNKASFNGVPLLHGGEPVHLGPRFPIEKKQRGGALVVGGLRNLGMFVLEGIQFLLPKARDSPSAGTYQPGNN